ncbi:sulfotransferase family protein [Litorisediminicola beolgyonensis]|uniref:Sulfotransferase family protein n=1 Tax=Litorisediminicola beolgyonensis TaxID=1173614 RepID=A0ABW3ZJF1_9RHOB
MALSVIGAGFGRTGTDSLKRALEMLGYNPCYHMYEVLPHQDRVDMWRGILGGAISPDWDAVFEGYSATVDWPTAHYWRELAMHYPDAKIVLSWRSPESWYASMDSTILQIMRAETDPATIPYKLGKAVFGGHYDDPEHVMGVYRRHVEEVRDEFGPDRLLTYELGSGWEPLCTFLGCAVPDEPYPTGNDGEQFHARVSAVEAERKAKVAEPPTA